MLPNFIILGLATATISVTVAQSRAFAWFREWIEPAPFFGELFSCPYCLGHWASAVLVYLWWHSFAFPFVLVAWLAVTAISALVSGAITRLFTGGD